MSTQKFGDKSAWNEAESSSGEGDKPAFSKRSKRHCSKWWWLYALVLVIIVIVIVIPIIFVGVRNVAQSSLNKATVTVDQQILTNPGPHSFDLTLNTTVMSNTDDSHGAVVSGFNASFYLLDTKPDIKPFIYAEFPEVPSANISQVNIAQKMTQVANMDQFIAYNKLVLESETFQIGVKGETHVLLKNLPKYTVTYDKIVTMKGFNKFSGFSIDTVQFHNPPEFDGATMTGTVSIPNPSVISAQFGNITMDLSANGTYLGYSVLEYVDYKPGPNTYNMRAWIDIAASLGYIHDYLLDLDIVGNSSVNIAGEHLTYFEEALRANTLHYQLNITKATSS